MKVYYFIFCGYELNTRVLFFYLIGTAFVLHSRLIGVCGQATGVVATNEHDSSPQGLP